MATRSVVDYPIYFKHHAFQRAAERFPGISTEQLVAEVRAALREGRLSGDRPDWLYPSNDIQHGLFAWTPDRVRTFGVLGGTDAWWVQTIIPARA